MSIQPHSPIPTPIPPSVSAIIPQSISRTSSTSSGHSTISTSPPHGLLQSQQQQQQQQQQHHHHQPQQAQPQQLANQLPPIIIPRSTSPATTYAVISPPGSPTRGRSSSNSSSVINMSLGVSATRPASQPTRRSMSSTEGLGILRMPPQSDMSSAPGAMATPPIGLTREGSAGMGFGMINENMLSNNVEDYEVRNPIGYGSSAVVYNALYKPLNKRIAIKMIDLDMFERNQIDELRRETALMALSKHPNVLRVYGSFVKGSKLYIVTPYLSGGSCLDIMKNAFSEGFDEVSIATIMRQALEGLIYLHRHGHIHRDVKAGNLLMDEDGQVLLADFGVSSSLVENGERGVRKTFVGTPCWMAPEVMEQAGYDYKADIWSFGITGLELATGHAPFAKYPPIKVLMLTLSNDPPTLDRETTKHKYTKHFKEMIDMCLQKDPNKRPTAEKLLQHAFFRQAKRKDYLVKTLLHGLPPLEQRPHKRVPHKHNSVGSKNLENWDFGGEGQRANAEESLSNSIMTDTDAEDEHEEQRRTQVSSSSVNGGYLGYDLPSSNEPKLNGPAKKHISFGDVVVKNPPSPGQPQPASSLDQPRRSRFVIEDAHPLTPVSNASPTSTAAVSNELAAPPTITTTVITATISASPAPSIGPYSLPVSPALLAMETRVEQDKALIGSSNNSNGKESTTTPTMSTTQTLSVNQHDKEVRKGRFSVTEGAAHPRPITPILDGNGTMYAEPGTINDKPGLTRTLSTDNLLDRRSRFELQHSVPASSQLPPPLPASVTGQLQPAPTIPSQRTGEGLLSRESSFSSTTSLTRGDGLAAKVSRFSVESRSEMHPKDCVPEGSNAVLETLLKQNETQRAVLTELLAGMGLAPLRNVREASKTLELYPAAPPSPAHPPTIPLSQQSTTTHNGAVASAGVGPHRYVFESESGSSEDGGVSIPHPDLLMNMQNINTQVQTVLKENDSLKRENDALKRELERLRKTITNAGTTSLSPATVALGTPNVVSGAIAPPNPANAPSSVESNVQRTGTASSAL